LTGFKDEYLEESKSELKLKSQDSVTEKLHVMRKLTDRILNNDSPVKSPQKIKNQETGVS
jgi:hypothetical protein